MPKVYRLEDMDAYQLPLAHIGLLPFGSLEQHDNLPLNTDTRIARCITSRIAPVLSETSTLDVIIYPPLTYGYSPEWDGMPGTVSIPMATVYGFLASIVEAASRNGARLFAVINAHSGNTGLLQASAPPAASAAGVPVIVLDIHKLLKECGAGPAGHACRVERALLRLCGYPVPPEPLNVESREIMPGVYHPANRRVYALEPPQVLEPTEETIDCITRLAAGIIDKVIRGAGKGVP